MKIVAGIYNLNTLKNTAELLDSAVLMVPKLAQIYENNFDVEEAIKICEENNIEIILGINKLIFDYDFDEILKFVNNHKQYKFLVSDLGLIQAFKEWNLSDSAIYDSSTMICNSLDLAQYKSIGLHTISLSNEIPLSDVISAYNITRANIYYQIFGHKLMFYSKRKLLSCYEKHSGDTFERNNLSIKEEKRDGLMPVFETDNGFFVYRNYCISLLNDIHNLDFLEYGYIETLAVDESIIKTVLKTFKSYKNKEIALENAQKTMQNLNILIENGFSYEDSIHKKEKIINE